jgi:hypothetical protein
VACDFELPCSSCLFKGLVCTNGRLLEDTSWSNGKILSRGYSPEEDDFSDLCCPSLRHFPIPFLTNFTKLENKTLQDTFGYSDADAEPKITSPAAISSLPHEIATDIEHIHG